MSDFGVQCDEEREKVAVPEHGDDIHMVINEDANLMGLRFLDLRFYEGPGRKINIYPTRDNLEVIGLQQDGLQIYLDPEAESKANQKLKDGRPNAIKPGIESDDDLETDCPGDNGGKPDDNFHEQTSIKMTGPETESLQKDNQAQLPPKKRRSNYNLKPVSCTNNKLVGNLKSPNKGFIDKPAPYKFQVSETIFEDMKRGPTMMEVNNEKFIIKPLNDCQQACNHTRGEIHPIPVAGAVYAPPNHIPPSVNATSFQKLPAIDEMEEHMSKTQCCIPLTAGIQLGTDVPMDLSRSSDLGYSHSTLSAGLYNNAAMQSYPSESNITSSMPGNYREKSASVKTEENQPLDMINTRVDDLCRQSPPTTALIEAQAASSQHKRRTTPEQQALFEKMLLALILKQQQTCVSNQPEPQGAVATPNQAVPESLQLPSNIPITETQVAVKIEKREDGVAHQLLTTNQEPSPMNSGVHQQSSKGLTQLSGFPQHQRQSPRIGMSRQTGAQQLINMATRTSSPQQSGASQMPNFSGLGLANIDGSLKVTESEQLKMKLKSQIQNKHQ